MLPNQSGAGGSLAWARRKKKGEQEKILDIRDLVRNEKGTEKKKKKTGRPDFQGRRRGKRKEEGVCPPCKKGRRFEFDQERGIGKKEKAVFLSGEGGEPGSEGKKTDRASQARGKRQATDPVDACDPKRGGRKNDYP